MRVLSQTGNKERTAQNAE